LPAPRGLAASYSWIGRRELLPRLETAWCIGALEWRLGKDPPNGTGIVTFHKSAFHLRLNCLLGLSV